MKKILFLMAMLSTILFTSCSKSENEPTADDDKNSIQQSDIVGVWKNGNYFVSFGSDGFCAAYIVEQFIDSGNYNLSNDVISCSNTYFNRSTTYIIRSVSDTELKVDITYTDLNGNNHNKAMTFLKDTTTPASRNNTLGGKFHTWQSTIFGNITMNFSTYNSGIKSATKGSAAKYPLNFFYIYIGERLYYQILRNNSIQVPTIGSWATSYDDVICWKLFFSPNGSISDTEYVTL